MPGPIFMKLGIVARQHLCKNIPTVARQQLGVNFIGATNTQKTIEELLDALFSMLSVSFQGK
jgi:hypothetical protein